MIERVSSQSVPDAFPPDWLGIQARTVLQNGSDRCFVQRTGDAYTALALVLLGTVRIKMLPGADTDELNAFADMLGITDIIVPSGYSKCFTGFSFRAEALMRLDGGCDFTQSADVHFAEYSARQKLFYDIYSLFFDSDEFFSEWYRDFMKALSRDAAACAYVERDGLVVSAAAVPYKTGDGAVLSGVATREGYRLRGFAGDCVRAASARAGEPIYLRCRKELCGFYEKLGYKNFGEVCSGKKKTDER